MCSIVKAHLQCSHVKAESVKKITMCQMRVPNQKPI